MEKVLFTVLKPNEKEIDTIEKARQKNAGGLLSYFYTTTSTMVPRPIQTRTDDASTTHTSPQGKVNGTDSLITSPKAGGVEMVKKTSLNNTELFMKKEEDRSAVKEIKKTPVDNKKYFNINFS